MYILHFDGLYRPAWYYISGNALPQDIMCYGWLIEQDRRMIARGHGGLLDHQLASSNAAEYIALIEGLEALQDLRLRHAEIQVTGDAKSVVQQMTGDARVSSEQIKPLYQKAVRLCNQFERLMWVWAPRRQNRAADQLTRRALKQIRMNRATSQASEQFNRAKGKVQLLDLRMIQY